MGYLQLGPAARPTRSTAGEVGYVVANVRDVQRHARRRHDPRRRPTAPRELLPGYRDVKSMVFAGLYPTDAEQYEDLRDALEKLQLNDASLHYEPETSIGARLRLPLRLPRPAAHGDRAGAARARVRARPRSPRCRPWSTTCYQTDGDDGAGREPEQDARPAQRSTGSRSRTSRRASWRPAEYIGAHHEAGPGAARRVPRHEVPRPDARGVRLGVPARPRSSSTSTTS